VALPALGEGIVGVDLVEAVVFGDPGRRVRPRLEEAAGEQQAAVGHQRHAAAVQGGRPAGGRVDRRRNGRDGAGRRVPGDGQGLLLEARAALEAVAEPQHLAVRQQRRVDRRHAGRRAADGDAADLRVPGAHHRGRPLGHQLARRVLLLRAWMLARPALVRALGGVLGGVLRTEQLRLELAELLLRQLAGHRERVRMRGAGAGEREGGGDGRHLGSPARDRP
jgi:hypothetical protein